MVLRSYAAGVVIRQHHIYYTERRYNHNVDLRVPEEPEQVVKQYYITAVGIIKESSVSVSIQQ